MEKELNELVQAWKICVDGTIRDANVRQNAFNYVENFKQTSPNILDIGFYLAYQKDSFELSHFGLQLITHTIKFKWNDFNDQMKAEVKNRLMNIIINLDENTNIKGPSYLKNSMCLVIIELIKREWPQNWPNLMNDLFEISNKSIEHKKLIFIILKYISEEFIDSEGTQTIQIPSQRRKDINQYLNQYMDSIFEFYLNCLEFCFESINKNDSANLNECIDLANTCLDSLSTYINWINMKLILSRNYSIINITLSLLNHGKLCVNSAKCLIGLSNRKGTAEERKPLLGMFSDAVLAQLMNCIKLSLENPSYKELLKYLVQILVGMGTQLNFLWSNASFPDKPANLNVFLNAIYELLLSENRMYSLESIQLWNALLQNQYINCDPNVEQYVILISQMLTNSYIMFKFNYSTMFENFDTEEEFHRFSQRYRTDLAKLIKLGSSLKFESYFSNSYDWTLKIFSETNKLDSNDQSGFDASSFLYLCWDAVILLWNTLASVLSKKINLPDVQEIKPRLMNLLNESILCKPLNPNYSSFNYSLMSSILNLTCDICDSQNKELVVKTVFEKLFTDLILFKAETIKYTDSAVKMKHILNLRRQITAVLLTVCKNYSKILFASFGLIYKSLLDIINSSDSTQMERGILIQALVYCSNESNSQEIQLNLAKQFLNPILDFFQANKFNFTNIDSFIKLVGLNDPSSKEGLENRKKIFYYINCLYGFLKCINFVPNNNNSSPNEITGIFMNLLEYLVDILKAFNMIHSISSVNKEYLDMTDSAKTLILGMHQEKHGKNQITVTSSDPNAATDQSDKLIMFIYNTYDTLNQLIGVYLTKFKQELLLIDLNQSPAHSEFVYKFGESLFTSFNQLPNFRIRYLIRYILKSCLTSVNFDKEILGKNCLILKLNEILLEYFLPTILSRINETNKMYSNMKKSQDDLQQVNTSQLQNQIIEENQFTLMCRDLIDLIRSFFNFAQPGLNQSSAEEAYANEDDENNEVNMDSAVGLKDNQSNSGQISELAIHLMRTNKIIYQSVILCLFDGLNWPDSYCCSRLIRLCQSLIDKFPILDQPLVQDQFGLYLSDQISERIFTYCLTALQAHGEHQEILSLLINLAYSIYDRSPVLYKQLYNKVLSQIPNLNQKSFDEFIVKVNKMLTGDLSSTGEKVRKDLFKKIVQPVVGKSIGQLYKYDIQIRVLEPLNLSSKKKRDSNLDGTNGTETSICSLFDSNN